MPKNIEHCLHLGSWHACPFYSLKDTRLLTVLANTISLCQHLQSFTHSFFHWEKKAHLSEHCYCFASTAVCAPATHPNRTTDMTKPSLYSLFTMHTTNSTKLTPPPAQWTEIRLYFHIISYTLWPRMPIFREYIYVTWKQLYYWPNNFIILQNNNCTKLQCFININI
jgi:hypothetical protein